MVKECTHLLIIFGISCWGVGVGEGGVGVGLRSRALGFVNTKLCLDDRR